MARFGVTPDSDFEVCEDCHGSGRLLVLKSPRRDALIGKRPWIEVDMCVCSRCRGIGWVLSPDLFGDPYRND